MTDQNNLQSKLVRETIAIISLTLGIISVITSGLGYIYLYGIYHWLDWTLLICSLLIPLAGLIFGIVGLKSPKKRVALAGMVLSGIGLIGAIFFNIIILSWHP